jgi:hypothetical protein
MIRLTKINSENKDQAIELIESLIEQYGATFHSESIEYLTPNNHQLVLETLSQRNKSTIIQEEIKYLNCRQEYHSLNKYPAIEILPAINTDDIKINISESSIGSIILMDETINRLVTNLSEFNKIVTDLTESELDDLKDSGITEYKCTLIVENNQITAQPIKSLMEKTGLAKIQSLLEKVNDAIVYSTKNIKPHHVKIGVAVVGIGLSMFGNTAFASDSDAMEHLLKVKEQMHHATNGSHHDSQLTADLLHSVTSHFKDFFHGTNHGTASVNVDSHHVGDVSIDSFHIEVKDTSHHACNINFKVTSDGDVSSSISKNDFGDFCKEEFKASAQVLAKHFAKLAKAKGGN